MFSAFLKAKPHDTLDLCGILNDDLAATVKRYPKRFVGLGTLPMQAPDLAVEEMRRCVNQLGFPGVQIGSHINTWDLNAPELYPVYAVSPFAFGSTCHSTLKYLVSFVIILSSSYSVLSQFVGHLKYCYNYVASYYRPLRNSTAQYLCIRGTCRQMVEWQNTGCLG